MSHVKAWKPGAACRVRDRTTKKWLPAVVVVGPDPLGEMVIRFVGSGDATTVDVWDVMPPMTVITGGRHG